MAEQSMTTPEKGRAIEPGDAQRRDGTRMIAVAAGHRIDSRDIFVDTREVIIQHGEETYRLRLTAQNRLILTK
jgi:hemin uptake protein HemP